MSNLMRAARMHTVGAPMTIDTVERPRALGTDVVVQVKACGMVPNLGNVLANWPTWAPHMPLPRLPAIFGLDPAGIVTEVGDKVIAFEPGDRVYVNPGRSCDGCERCLAGERTQCRYFTFNGYFGFQKESQTLYDFYPQGGFCEYMSAPQYALVKLPSNVTFEQAARFGYLGTAYSAIKKAGVVTGKSILINGISGTLGLGATLFALAMGAARIFGTGRNVELLKRVKALAPDRIETHALADGPINDWIRSRTNGAGVDMMVDALGAAADLSTLDDAMHAVRRGGKILNIGGTLGKLPVDVKWLMDEQIHFIGSVWFSSSEGTEMAQMARTGTLNLSIFQHHSFPLEQINEAINGLVNRNGGFSNYVIVP